MKMRLCFILSFFSCYCTKYVFGVTTQSSENAVVKETDTIREVNVMKDNYHELLKRVMNNEIEIEDLKRREQYLKHELENTKRYVSCQMEDLNDITKENHDKLNKTQFELMKTRNSFNPTLASYNETIQELSDSLEIAESLRCKKNLTELSNRSGSFQDTISSPGYPSEYGNNLNLSRSIDVGSGYIAKIQFTDFSTEDNFDVVKVYDGNSTTNLLRSMSGHNLPPELRSTDRYIFVTFTSDHSITYTGFRASIYRIPR
ncbi:CSMD [Mytilus coruscus]|uniref:CSMD n=1 Tax=Mytilus coruscus TaxID=42192 RepID=A0A6J8EXS9_MYTCO|nr:CSMD [Mytilus coruscus]